jgi:hypothetical protein
LKKTLQTCNWLFFFPEILLETLTLLKTNLLKTIKDNQKVSEDVLMVFLAMASKTPMCVGSPGSVRG